MELVMMEWVRRRNLLTTATPTVYDFIAGSYILSRNIQKKWQQTPSAIVTASKVDSRLLVFIMKLIVYCCKLLFNLNRLCCVGVGDYIYQNWTKVYTL